jgi:hypothetical protein
MKNIFLTSLLLFFLLSSCTVVQQAYSFSHHGTDSIKTDSNFKYVARNVLGKARSTIKMSAWKKTTQKMATDGLLSEAKSNLPALKDNQAFANMSIDVLTTRMGQPTSGGINLKELTLEVVVSTDIVEYY